jgi:lipopolysaccharide export LptBFGC system permease protein LptF
MLFIVMMSLRIVVDLSIHLDNFIKDPDLTTADKLKSIVIYYSYQSVLYIQELGGILIVVAGAFTLGRMNHTNELTAMLASGVSLKRVVFPIIVCAILLDVLVVLDQEYVVPRVADKLVRNREEVNEITSSPVCLMTDEANTSWLAARLKPDQKTMELVTAICRDPHGRWLGMATALQATESTLRDDDGERPGWSLLGSPDQPAMLELPQVTEHPDQMFDVNPHHRMPTTDEIYVAGPDRLLQSLRDDVIRDGHPPEFIERLTEVTPPGDRLFRNALDKTHNVEIRYKSFRPAQPGVLAPAELRDVQFVFRAPDGTPFATILADRAVWRQSPDEEGRWRLTRGRIFIATEFSSNVLVLQGSSRWLDFMSTSALADLIALGRVRNEPAARLAFHSRVTLPIDNIIMLLLGLPFILSRERNIKASAALCLLVTASFLVFVYLCQYTLEGTPLLAAWLPVLIFGPLSVVMLDSVKT